MLIENKSFSSSYLYGLFNNKPAYKDYYKKIIYVFKDISSKRIKTNNNFTRENKYYKIVFLTNTQLLSIDYFSEIKDCIFDGKLGTKYHTNSSCGPYHWCLRQNEEKPKVRKRHKS